MENLTLLDPDQLHWCTYMLLSEHPKAHKIAIQRLAYTDRHEATRLLLCQFEREADTAARLEILEAISNHTNPATEWAFKRLIDLSVKSGIESLRKKALALLK